MKFQKTDVAIIGGGLAGATAAAMLGRAGHESILIDPHTEHRQEFRCEKLDDSQLALLRIAGLADDVLPHACVDGDVYSTSCPAAGTGANKVLTDVQRLSLVYVPEWLAKDSIGAADVAEFYSDPVKVQCEAESMQKAMWLRRVSTGTSFGWRCWRGARFVAQTALGRLRNLKRLTPATATESDFPGRA